MTIDFNDPEVKSALEERAKAIAEETIGDNYVPVQDVEGLKNKNTELLGKMAKYKEQINGIDPKDLEEMKRVKAAREHDEIVDMVLSGKSEQAKAKLTEGILMPWKEKYSALEEQFTTREQRIKELEGEFENTRQKLTETQKRQYLRELTAEDDSFKKDYFDDFFQLNASRIEIDEETGNVYAKDPQTGKAILDTDGGKVKYADFYQKQKVSNSLFWSGGEGSGAKGASGAAGLPKDPGKWTSEQKADFIRENGPEAFAKVLHEHNASKRG